MGCYSTNLITDEEAEKIIKTLRIGYSDNGITHRPNDQIATILLLQANLGCRIGDIVNLTVESFTDEAGTHKLDMVEEKTGKKRNFIVPDAVYDIINRWTTNHGIYTGRIFKCGEQAVWKALRQVTSFLGLKNVSAHSFRKNAGMRIYKDSGKDIALTTQFYQHSSPDVTMRYLKRSSKQMDEAISKSSLLV